MREFIDGATAIARASLDAGCDFFAGYPISPATPLLLHMIGNYRRLVGSPSRPRRDRFHQYVHWRGHDWRAGADRDLRAGAQPVQREHRPGDHGEVPLVIVDAQRMGPATGGATTPGQGDVQFVRWGTSGGYPIIALAPGSVAECYGLTRRAFDLAERFRFRSFCSPTKRCLLPWPPLTWMLRVPARATESARGDAAARYVRSAP